MSPRWTDDRCDALGQCIDAGLTSERAAAVLGVGARGLRQKASRLGWSFGQARTEGQKQRPFRNLTEDRRPKLHLVQLRLDPDTFAEVTARAVKEGVPRTAVIRDLIEWGLLSDGPY